MMITLSPSPSRQSFRWLAVAALSATLTGTGSGCRQRSPANPVKIYKLTGVVRKVDRDSGSVTIRHDALPGFMEAMTMPFTLKAKDLLDDVRPGDEVEGSLRVVFEKETVRDYELTDLVVTRPAPPAPLRLTLSGETARLETAPKVLQAGQIVPDFAMTTQEGMDLKLSDLRGQVVVLTFVYTRCPLPDFCPALDRKFAELASRIGAFPERAKQVRLLSVSFDPEHDTPEVLRQHARSAGAEPPLWTFAVATHPELAKIVGPLGLTYGPTATEIIHSLSTAVIDEQGRLVVLEAGASGKGWKPAELLKPIIEQLKKAR